MRKEVKRQGLTLRRGRGSPGEALTKEYLWTAFKEGSSQGGTTKDLAEQFKHMKINQHKGRTIQMMDSERKPKKIFYSKDLFEEPMEIKNDKDVM